jgi:hypothetical protein
MADDAELGKLVGEVAVSYSVKELLARIEERQIRQDEKMTLLASAEEVAQLRRQVERHEARWNRVLGAAIGISLVAGGVGSAIFNLVTGTS